MSSSTLAQAHSCFRSPQPIPICSTARTPVRPLLHGTPPPLVASERRFGSCGARIDGSRGRSGGCGHQIGGGGGRIPRWWSSNQRRRRSAVLQSAAAEPEWTAVRRPTRARELASSLARTGLSFCSPFVLHGLHSVRGWAYPQPRLDVCWIGYVSSTYRNFVLFIFLPILHGYVSTAYPMRIHIGYISDTGYAPSLAYRGNVAGTLLRYRLETG